MQYLTDKEVSQMAQEIGVVLTDKELVVCMQALNRIVEFVEPITNVDTNGVEPLDFLQEEFDEK
ncbi:MAG: hypothetical protein JXR42_01430 [Gammaproteobacteria bacterium]|nr:hypothetical protein [Gammaproteobacteria bacterium]